eukprot:TRINITY_DN7717_c0_g1_i6.p1 TRINITY_DN7717_c0_g1~~TRINITY_DN7717_c0_g1_i6.p1  ORF type:complete len:100 (-),score=7.64 TRINITY_DN7717_c0_g1_i6:16-315(-)
MANKPSSPVFVNLEDFRQTALSVWSKSVRDYYESGANQQITLKVDFVFTKLILTTPSSPVFKLIPFFPFVSCLFVGRMVVLLRVMFSLRIPLIGLFSLN